MADENQASNAQLVLPGDVIATACPEGESPLLNLGESLQIKGKDTLLVYEISGHQMKLLPLVSGNIDVSIPCTNQTSAKVQVSVNVREDMANFESMPPLTPLWISYPAWLWLSIGLVLFAIIAGILAVLEKQRRKRKAKEELNKKIKEDLPLLPIEALKNYLYRVESSDFLKPSADTQKLVRPLYDEGVRLARALIDDKFKHSLDAQSATSTEYIGHVKLSISQRKEVNTQIAQTIEGLLLHADQVRFAGLLTTPEMRKIYIQQITEVLKTFQKLP